MNSMLNRLYANGAAQEAGYAQTSCACTTSWSARRCRYQMHVQRERCRNALQIAHLKPRTGLVRGRIKMGAKLTCPGF
jgi:hypothetical protein